MVGISLLEMSGPGPNMWWTCHMMREWRYTVHAMALPLSLTCMGVFVLLILNHFRHHLVRKRAAEHTPRPASE